MNVVVVVALSSLAIPHPIALLSDVRQVREDVVLATPRRIGLHWQLGRALSGPLPPELIECGLSVQAGIRLTRDAIWVGLSVGDRRQIFHLSGRPDWSSLGDALAEYKQMPAFEDRGDITLAVDDDISVEHIARAIDESARSGFDDVRYTVPGWEPVVFIDDDPANEFPLRVVNRHTVELLILESGVLVRDDTGEMELIRVRRRRDDIDAVEKLLARYRARATRIGRLSSHVTIEVAVERAVLSRVSNVELAAARAGLTLIHGGQLGFWGNLRETATEMGILERRER